MALHLCNGLFEQKKFAGCVASGGARRQFGLENAPRFVQFAESDAFDKQEKIWSGLGVISTLPAPARNRGGDVWASEAMSAGVLLPGVSVTSPALS
jgi:hypothetical protein